MTISQQTTDGTTDHDTLTDYNYSRLNYYNLQDVGQEAIQEMLELCKESDSPRAFEVLGKLIKDVGDVNEKILNLQKVKRDIQKLDGGESPDGAVTNNNIFVGSTADLQKMLSGQSEEKEINGDSTE